jgi:hypothetical protein
MTAGHLSSEFRRAYGESPHGTRDCAGRDPAGNMVRIQELR